jgi:hypothetical protein
MNTLVSRRRLLATGAIGVAATAAAAAHAAEEHIMSQVNMSQVSVTSRTIPVEHIRIASARPFAEVRRKLEETVPKLDPSIAEALARGDQKRAQDYDENGPKLSIFLTREHGALLEIAGGKRNAVQYEIGNPPNRHENDASSASGRALRAVAGGSRRG